MGSDPRLAAECRASVLRATESDSRRADFDGYVEGLCARFYADEGRPGLPPGRYFRLLLIGYFEGLDAERAIAWRAADSFAIVGVTVQNADDGDTTTCIETPIDAAERVEAVRPDGDGIQDRRWSQSAR